MNWKNRLTNYNFWVSIVSAVILILQALKIKFDFAYINEVFTAVLGLLVVIGIINDPTKSYKTETTKTKEETKQEETKDETDSKETNGVEENIIPTDEENENDDGPIQNNPSPEIAQEQIESSTTFEDETSKSLDDTAIEQTNSLETEHLEVSNSVSEETNTAV